MDAIILAGGFGTRLASVVQNVPKPMAPVAGSPFLEYLISYLKTQGVTRVVLAVCHKKECIIRYFGESFQEMEIIYSVEDTPLDTGGAIKKALSLCTDHRVYVLNGDSFLGADLGALRRAAEETGSAITMVLKPMEHFSRYGTVEADEQGRVTAFYEKKPCISGAINGGIYDIRRDTLSDYPEKFSMEVDCFPKLLQKGDLYAMRTDGYFIDIGIPEDYERVQQEYRSLQV